MVIGVYGLGRFGAFWAARLAEHFSVIAWSRDVSRPAPAGVRRVSEEEVLSADVLVLCVAISAMEEVLERIAPRIGRDTLVMDTCSVKVYPARLMAKILPGETSILATHPMFGPDSGRNGIQGLPLVFSPVRISDETAGFWKNSFRTMGLNVVEMSADQHDREASYTQGITHFIGRVLGELDLGGSDIATTGYKDLLDIVRQTCNDPWKLFIDLQKYNPYTGAMRNDLHEAITVMLDKFDSIDAIDGGEE